MNYLSALGEKTYKAVRCLLPNRFPVKERIHHAMIELISSSVRDEIKVMPDYKVSGRQAERILQIIDLYNEICEKLCDRTKPGSEGHIMNSINSYEEWELEEICGRILYLDNVVTQYNAVESG